MAIQRWECIDAGSDYCPCYLAETMDCITCSHLKGKEFCDCEWRGVCIYQAYIFEGNRKKEPREDIEAPIIETREYGENIIIFTLKIPHTLARELNQPGAYIFIRNEKFKHYFDIPISIMQVDTNKDLIRLAVEIHGVKTKTIKTAKNHLLIRGPYWNGLLGLRHLKQTRDSNCLFVVRGIAQAPAILAVNYLLRNNNTVDLIIDTGTANYDFMEDYCEINEFKKCNLYESEGIKLLDKQINSKKYSLVFIGTSDYLRENLYASNNKLKEIKNVTTNNNEICCGEGICGSCTIYDIDGMPIRTCKTQVIRS